MCTVYYREQEHILYKKRLFKDIPFSRSLIDIKTLTFEEIHSTNIALLKNLTILSQKSLPSLLLRQFSLNLLGLYKSEGSYEIVTNCHFAGQFFVIFKVMLEVD